MATGRLCPPAGFAKLKELAAAVQKQEVSSAQLVEVCLSRIQEAPPCSKCSFVQLYSSEARTSAAALDAKMATSVKPVSFGPLAGVPVAVKDLLDVSGHPTWGGRPPAEHQALAHQDAVVVQRLRAAGAVLLGKTHLTELAAVGHGYNQHYETPTSPFKRLTSGDGYLPGGSSAGSAVAVADGLVPIALGSDTGGSIRIPAAWCGAVGFKPSFGRVPVTGCLPLGDYSLDTIGPIGRCVEDCAVVFRVLAGIAEPSLPCIPSQVESMTFLIPTYCLEELDEDVKDSFESAVSALEKAGARVQRLGDLDPLLRELHGVMLVTFNAEVAANYQDFLADDRGKSFGSVVRSRIEEGAKVSAAEYLRAQKRRKLLCSQMDEATKPYDAVLMPSVRRRPILVSDAKASEDALQQTAKSCSLNTRLGNLLGRCATSLPCHSSEVPVGIMVMGEVGDDEHCLEVSMAVEAVLKGSGLGSWPAISRKRKLESSL